MPPSFQSLIESIGWSDKELAERMGVSTVTVYRWKKNGAPKYVITYLEQVNKLVGKHA